MHKTKLLAAIALSSGMAAGTANADIMSDWSLTVGASMSEIDLLRGSKALWEWDPSSAHAELGMMSLDLEAEKVLASGASLFIFYSQHFGGNGALYGGNGTMNTPWTAGSGSTVGFGARVPIQSVGDTQIGFESSIAYSRLDYTGDITYDGGSWNDKNGTCFDQPDYCEFDYNLMSGRMAVTARQELSSQMSIIGAAGLDIHTGHEYRTGYDGNSVPLLGMHPFASAGVEYGINDWATFVADAALSRGGYAIGVAVRMTEPRPYSPMVPKGAMSTMGHNGNWAMGLGLETFAHNTSRVLPWGYGSGGSGPALEFNGLATVLSVARQVAHGTSVAFHYALLSSVGGHQYSNWYADPEWQFQDGSGSRFGVDTNTQLAPAGAIGLSLKTSVAYLDVSTTAVHIGDENGSIPNQCDDPGEVGDCTAYIEMLTGTIGLEADRQLANGMTIFGGPEFRAGMGDFILDGDGIWSNHNAQVDISFGVNAGISYDMGWATLTGEASLGSDGAHTFGIRAERPF